LSVCHIFQPSLWCCLCICKLRVVSCNNSRMADCFL
jgi:hypothetical protein